MKYVSVNKLEEKINESQDVVEIVRCHACKWHLTEDCPSTIRDYGGYYKPQISDSGFCSRGELKDD